MNIHINPYQAPDSNQVEVNFYPENDSDVMKMFKVADSLKDLGVEINVIKIGDWEVSRLSFHFRPVSQRSVQFIPHINTKWPGAPL